MITNGKIKQKFEGMSWKITNKTSETTSVIEFKQISETETGKGESRWNGK